MAVRGFQPSSFEMRWTVPVPIPSDLATFNIPTPFASCFRTLRSVALSIFGRPNDPGRSATRQPAHFRERLYRPVRRFEAGRGAAGAGVCAFGEAAGAAGGAGRVKLTGPPAISR